MLRKLIFFNSRHISLAVTRVHNLYGPQTRPEKEAADQKVLPPDIKPKIEPGTRPTETPGVNLGPLSDAVEERVGNLEQHLKLPKSK